MRQIRNGWWILLLLCSVPSFAGDFEKKAEQFDTQVFELRQKSRISGLAAGIVKEGKLAWSAAYGFADIDQTIPVTIDTPYWIDTVTMTFTGLLFLQLEEAGKVNLQDRISDVPGWDDYCVRLSRAGMNIRCDAPITIDNILRQAATGTPGTQFRFTPLLYSMLPRYLDHKSGAVPEAAVHHNATAQQLEEKILKPAGMQHTMAGLWQREKCAVFFDMAQGLGLTPEGKLAKRPLPDRDFTGAAGVVSTISDLARYDAALDAGTLGSRTVMAKLFTPTTPPEGKPMPFTYGWYAEDYRGARLYWHSGWDPDTGYSALILKAPAKRLTLILLANGEGLWWNNPPDTAIVEQSPIARSFLELFGIVKD